MDGRVRFLPPHGFGLRVSILLVLSIAGLAGCAASGPRQVSVTTEPGIERVARGGLAIAPSEVLLGPDVPAQPPADAVGPEIHANLALALRETRVASPDSVRVALESAGPGVLAWRRLVRAMGRGERTGPDEMGAFAPAFDVDFVLVTWLREDLETGTEPVSADPDAEDFSGTDFPATGGLAPYREVVGALHGHVVELATGRTVWSAREPYRTGHVYGEDPLDDVLRRVRLGAASGLALALEASLAGAALD